MYIAAAEAIVGQTPEKELVPDPLDPRLHDRVAKAVAEAAVKSGVGQPVVDEDETEAVT
jgi:malic enzyme